MFLPSPSPSSQHHTVHTSARAEHREQQQPMGKACGDSELCLHPAGTCPRWPPAGVPDEGEARMWEIIGRAEGRFYRPAGAVGGGSPMRRSLQRFLQKRRERILGAGEPYVRRKPEAPEGEAEAVCTSLCL